MKKKLDQLGRIINGLLGRITVKIWVYSASVGMAAILLVLLLFQIVFNDRMLEASLKSSAQATLSAVESTDASMDYIVNRMIRICTRTSDFRHMLKRVRSAGSTEDKQLNNDLQSHLQELSSCHPLVLSSMLVSRSEQVFYPVTRGINAAELHYRLGYAAQDIRGITLLPTQKSPFVADGSVMPLAIPFGFFAGDTLLCIAEESEAAEAMLYLFLDVNSLNTTLALYNDSGVNLLLNARGDVINYPADSRQASLAQHSGLSDAVAGWDGHDNVIRMGRWYALIYRVGQYDLYLAHLVEHDVLMAPQQEIFQGLLIAAFVTLVIITMAALLTAVYLTKPMKQVNRAVKAIENGEYSSSMILHQQDEIGELSRSVDSMYRTIQAQIDQIRHERQAKDNMEIRLFAEQINPHFLYNTLEYVNLEVYNHHTHNASMMIQALGDFLRIGLNFGKEQIPLQRELDHVKAYITIMNCRFGQEIGFTTDIPEALLAEPVVKIILQPLVENSIRHGFQMENCDSFLEIPTVSIRGSVKDGMLMLSVIDNGTGFDVEDVRRIMHEDPSLNKHVGLSNVYHRLKLYYGERADIVLHSIPYYKNTVSIRIPFHSRKLEEGQK